ncbi:hypothetical protein AWW66_05215 [Micromonospora rosaria]|uniref:Tat pathway signal sequence domain protein n=1 Tax=Micromonospora rosaria TaxID=47874 RepID=A0A136PXA4_9ACTN|nr:hypothetical protein AWW66_05215 [Micromonospora rosaria]
MLALLAAVTGPVAPAAANPGPAGAGTSAVSAPGPDRQAPPGAVTYREQGTRNPTGTCTFTTEGKRDARKGPAVLFFTELSYDPGTCSRTMARVEYSPDDVPPALARRFEQRDERGQERTESGEKAPAPRSNAAAGEMTVIPFWVEAQAWWEDKVYIDLTMTRSRVSGAFVLEDLGRYGASYHESYWYWFDTSGWRRDSADNLFHADFYNALTNTVGTFSNPIFYLPGICDGIGQVTYSGHPHTFVYYSAGFVGYSLVLERAGNCRAGMVENFAVWIA